MRDLYDTSVLFPEPIRLLLICKPAAYPPKVAETPELYQHLAADPRFELFHCDPTWLWEIEDDGKPLEIPVVPVPRELSYEEFLELSDRSQAISNRVSSFDLAFCRTLKPFPLGYMERLEELERAVKFVNSPQGIVTHLQPTYLPSIAPGLTPDLIVTRDVDAATDFIRQHQRVVAKKAKSCGGKGVFRIAASETGFVIDGLKIEQMIFRTASECLEFLFELDGDPFQFVRYLPLNHHGDKRVLVVDGETYGAYLRKGPAGSWIHNVSSGGSYQHTTISDREHEIIRRTAPHYRRLGVTTLGYDFLMDDDGQWTLSEINAGNIAGYSLLEELTGQPIYDRFADFLYQYAPKRTRSHCNDRKWQCLGGRVIPNFLDAPRLAEQS